MKKIGCITPKVESLLQLNIADDRNIYIGDTNIQHMQTSHPADFQRYHSEIPNILASPDYVGINAKDNSIEYVKEFQVNNELVKVAVRISSGGQKYFARSVYVLNRSRVFNFIQRGTLKKY